MSRSFIHRTALPTPTKRVLSTPASPPPQISSVRIPVSLQAIPLEHGAADALLCDLPFEGATRFGHSLDTARGASLENVLREFARVLRPPAGRARCSETQSDTAARGARDGAPPRAVLLISEAQHATFHKALVGSGLRPLHERLCPLGFTRAVIVVTEVSDTETADTETAEAAEAAEAAAARVGGAEVAAAEEPGVEAEAEVAASASTASAPASRVHIPSRLPWETKGARSEWASLKKAERAPMVPWWRPQAIDTSATSTEDACGPPPLPPQLLTAALPQPPALGEVR